MNFCKIEEDEDAKSSRRDEVEGVEDITIVMKIMGA